VGSAKARATSQRKDVYSIQRACRACRFSLNGQSFPPILKEVDLRFYLDSATAQPHIYKHDVDEEEVEEVLTNPGEDRPGRDGSRVAIGQTASGRYLKVVYIRDPKPDSVFVITAYELRGKPLLAYRRRQRTKHR
jgi:Domain of unknown function (DUF4258)